jgi:hypothetical protein
MQTDGAGAIQARLFHLTDFICRFNSSVKCGATDTYCFLSSVSLLFKTAAREPQFGYVCYIVG